MTIKIRNWKKEDVPKILSERLRAAIEAKESHVSRWRQHEAVLYAQVTGLESGSDRPLGMDGMEEEGGCPTGLSTHFNFRYFRFVHSQLAANPPAVTATPSTRDAEDRRRADAVNHCINYSKRRYHVNEEKSIVAADTLALGNGCIKTIWNQNEGEIISVNKRGEVTMEGDIEVSHVSAFNIFPDPAPSKWRDLRYIFEQFFMPLDEAVDLLGDEYEDLLEAAVVSHEELEGGIATEYSSVFSKDYADCKVVRIYQYWEPGKPHNGMLGRMCWCTHDGELLSDVGENPHQFASINSEAALDPDIERNKLPKRARLPYHLWTDIDMPRSYWGMSILDFTTANQEAINEIDTSVLQTISLHGHPKLILPDSAEVPEDAIDNDPSTIIRVKSNQDPHYMEVAELPAFVEHYRNKKATEIMEDWGLNENALGKSSREQSGAMMQYATQQSNQARHRLFEKYTKFVENVYRDILGLMIENWDTPRQISALGKEKAFEAMDLEGTDIDGGWDLQVEYGVNLPLDPIMRQEQIMQLLPLFKESNIPTTKLLHMLKLSDLGGAFDILELGKDRQREIFEEMDKTRQYIKPEVWQDHASMNQYAQEYVMTAEFKTLDDEVKKWVTQHFEERKEMQAKQIGGGQRGAPQGAPAEQVAPPSPGNLGQALGII